MPSSSSRVSLCCPGRIPTLLSFFILKVAGLIDMSHHTLLVWGLFLGRWTVNLLLHCSLGFLLLTHTNRRVFSCQRLTVHYLPCLCTHYSYRALCVGYIIWLLPNFLFSWSWRLPSFFISLIETSVCSSLFLEICTRSTLAGYICICTHTFAHACASAWQWRKAWWVLPHFYS